MIWNLFCFSKFLCVFNFFFFFFFYLANCGDGYKMRTVSCYNTKLDPTMTCSTPVDDELCTNTKPTDQTVKKKNIVT
jgi:hypothetical protein